MDWQYTTTDGEQAGPVSETLIKMLIVQKQISRDTLVWNESLPDWAPAGNTSLSVYFKSAVLPQSTVAPPPVPNTPPQFNQMPNTQNGPAQAKLSKKNGDGCLSWILLVVGVSIFWLLLWSEYLSK